jgi:hypothetical protein
MRTCFAIIVLGFVMSAQAADVKQPWVSLDDKGHPHYRTTERGDRIMDFSSVGYQAGFGLPENVGTFQTLAPSGGDDSDAIQKALDAAGSADHNAKVENPLTVLLQPGTYQLSKPLVIKKSRTVLRGSGDNTILKLIGKPHVAIAVGTGSGAKPKGHAVSISDVYVPSGAISIHVKDASPFKPGQIILIHKPITTEWVHFMGMDTMVRNGKKERWVSGQIVAERRIKRVAGDELTLDVPLSDSLDAKFLGPDGATVTLATVDRIDQVGVEHLRIETPPQAVTISEPLFSGIRESAVEDGWINDVSMHNVVGAVTVGAQARQVTVRNVRVTHDVPTKGSAKPADFEAAGSQVLFDRCTSAGDDLFYFVTGARTIGPVVLLECTFTGGGWIQPHQRWATGLLVDNCRVPGGGIDFMNRGEMGSGHGWTIGWAVAWNCTAKLYIIQNPPGALNWAIGCQGSRETSAMPFAKEPKIPEGAFESHGKPTEPASLYRAQLAERQNAR